MLNRIIPSPGQVRWAGLAAMVGGILGLVFAPLYSLAYFATADGAADGNPPWVRAWADPARDFLDPLLTFASPDVVRLTYFKLFLFIVVGLLAGLVGLHASQARYGGRLERWGFRASLLGLLLLTIGALSGYWPPLLGPKHPEPSGSTASLTPDFPHRYLKRHNFGGPGSILICRRARVAAWRTGVRQSVRGPIDPSGQARTHRRCRECDG